MCIRALKDQDGASRKLIQPFIFGKKLMAIIAGDPFSFLKNTIVNAAIFVQKLIRRIDHWNRGTELIIKAVKK